MSEVSGKLITTKEMRNEMNTTLGQITDEILNAVKAYHIASMGNDNREIADAQDEYQRMIRVHGVGAVDVAVRWYNENVIGKA